MDPQTVDLKVIDRQPINGTVRKREPLDGQSPKDHGADRERTNAHNCQSGRDAHERHLGAGHRVHTKSVPLMSDTCAFRQWLGHGRLGGVVFLTLTA